MGTVLLAEGSEVAGEADDYGCGGVLDAASVAPDDAATVDVVVESVCVLSSACVAEYEVEWYSEDCCDSAWAEL